MRRPLLAFVLLVALTSLEGVWADDDAPPAKDDQARPGVVLDLGVIAHDRFAWGLDYGRITDIQRGDFDPHPGFEIAVTGTKGAFVIDDETRGLLLSSTMFHAEKHCPEAIHPDGDGTVEYVDRPGGPVILEANDKALRGVELPSSPILYPIRAVPLVIAPRTKPYLAVLAYHGSEARGRSPRLDDSMGELLVYDGEGRLVYRERIATPGSALVAVPPVGGGTGEQLLLVPMGTEIRRYYARPFFTRAKPPPTPSAWPKISTAQATEAKKHEVPPTFENELGMRFVLMPAGTFLMGSPEDEPGRDQDETQHRVTITKPYYMQMTEVTNDQYFGYARPVEGKRWVEPPSVFGLAQPVVHVSQLDAQAFARWVTLLDSHRTYRLPTEAEWEYACRAGTTTAFAFGDRLRADQANVETDAGGKRAEKRVPKPVGSFPPNAWGLYDMHGNVMEWCEGALSEYPAAAVTDPPPVPGEGGYVGILRGGSYGGPARDARSAARYGSRHDMPFWWTVGFRLVAPLPDAD